MRAFVSMACAVALIGSASVAAAQGKSAPKVKTTAGAGTVHGKSATYKPRIAEGRRRRPPGTAKTTGTAKATGSPKTTASTKATKATGHAKTTTTSTTTT